MELKKRNELERVAYASIVAWDNIMVLNKVLSDNTFNGQYGREPWGLLDLLRDTFKPSHCYYERYEEELGGRKIVLSWTYPEWLWDAATAVRYKYHTRDHLIKGTDADVDIQWIPGPVNPDFAVLNVSFVYKAPVGTPENPELASGYILDMRLREIGLDLIPGESDDDKRRRYKAEWDRLTNDIRPTYPTMED